jgi:hypothetical protein
MALRNGLYSRYSCDSGPVFADSTGNTFGLAVQQPFNGDFFNNGVTHSAGLIGDAADNSGLDGNTGEPNILHIYGMGCPIAEDAGGTSAWSLSFWVKTTASSGTLLQQGYPNFGNSESENWELNWNGTNIGSSGLGGLSDTNNTDIGDDSWHHICLTYNGSGTLKLYVDGTLGDTKSVTVVGGMGQSNFEENNSEVFFLGNCDNDGSDTHLHNQIAGLLDEVAVFSRALTSSEATALYNSGAGLSYPGFGYSLNFATQPSNTVAGASMSPSPAVEVLDESGNRDTSATDSITLDIGTNPSGGTLTTGTNPKAATSGLATFNSTSINNAGTGYTLTAAATDLTGATSSTFNITAVTATPGGTYYYQMLAGGIS